MDFEFELYKGKKYSDLLQDIVKNHKNKQTQVKSLIGQLTDMVDDAGTAVIVVPLIKEYLEIDVKNDEALVKLAQIASKAIQTTSASDGFSDKDLEMLFGDIQKTTAPLEEKDVKELPNIEQ